MPFITVKVLEGKTTEQKRQLIERIYGKNGKLFSDLDK